MLTAVKPTGAHAVIGEPPSAFQPWARQSSIQGFVLTNRG
jgi:hypothetical protein